MRRMAGDRVCISLVPLRTLSISEQAYVSKGHEPEVHRQIVNFRLGRTQATCAAYLLRLLLADSRPLPKQPKPHRTCVLLTLAWPIYHDKHRSTTPAQPCAGFFSPPRSSEHAHRN